MVVGKKQNDVSFSCVSLVTDDEFSHNTVTILAHRRVFNL